MARFDQNRVRQQQRLVRQRRFGVTEPAPTPPPQPRSIPASELRSEGKAITSITRTVGRKREKLQSAKSKGNPAVIARREQELAEAEAELRRVQRSFTPESYDAALRAAPRDYNLARGRPPPRVDEDPGTPGYQGPSARERLRQVRQEQSQTFQESRRTPGIYEAPSGTFITQLRSGSYSGGRLVVSETRQETPARLRKLRSSQTQTASVASPTLTSVRSPPPAANAFSTPKSSAGVGLTQQNIRFLSTPGRAQRVREAQLTTAIRRVQEREEQSGIRSQRARDIFRVGILRGDNFAQRTAREALALPGSFGPELGATIASSADRARIAVLSSRVQPRRTRQELLGAARETPGAMLRGFDPRTPRGLVNLGVGAAFGGTVIARGRVAPARAGQSLGVTRVRTPTGRTIISEQVRLRGGFNRALDRRATQTTTQFPTGTVSTTLRTPTGLRQTATFRPAPNTLTFTRGGVQRVRRAPRTIPVEPVVFETGFAQPTTLRQRTLRTEPVGSLRLDQVRRQSQPARATLGGRTSQLGELTVQDVSRLSAEVGPTRLVSESRVVDLAGREAASFITRDSFQRPLRLGKRTSRAETRQGRTQPSIDLDASRVEQTRIVARTPEPRSVLTSEQRVRFDAPPPPPRRLFPRGRRGSATAPPEFLRQIRQPRIVRSPRLPTRVTELRTPRLNVGGASGSLVSGAFVAATARGRIVNPQTSPNPLAQLPTRQDEFFKFDIQPVQGQEQVLPQQALPDQRSGQQLVSSLSPSLPSPVGGGAPNFPGGGRGLPPPPFFLKLPPTGSGRGRGSRRRGAQRSFRPSRNLFEVTFGLGGKTPTKDTFTGLELTRSR